MREAFKNGNVWGGLIRAPLALATEAASSLLMENAAARQKLGVSPTRRGSNLRDLGRMLRSIWCASACRRYGDSVDNCMGQLVYDNQFWDRTAKDLAMLTVRSVGWNLGTLREVGGVCWTRWRFQRSRWRQALRRCEYPPAELALLGATTVGAIAGGGPSVPRYR